MVLKIASVSVFSGLAFARFEKEMAESEAKEGKWTSVNRLLMQERFCQNLKYSK